MFLPSREQPYKTRLLVWFFFCFFLGFHFLYDSSEKIENLKNYIGNKMPKAKEQKKNTVLLRYNSLPYGTDCCSRMATGIMANV